MRATPRIVYVCMPRPAFFLGWLMPRQFRPSMRCARAVHRCTSSAAGKCGRWVVERGVPGVLRLLMPDGSEQG